MRPQQNRRMRGRGNNNSNNNNNNSNQNRRGPNPLTRSYESNGPDVKIRGSAQQIAEKYTTLARDAQSSGDRVMAENYLQHAEHYNRIIMAAQAQLQQQQQFRDQRDEDDADDEADEFGNDMPREQHQPRQDHNQHRHNDRHNGGQDSSRSNGSGPQPVIEGVPAEVALKQDAGTGNNVAPQASDQVSASEQQTETATGENAPADGEAPRRPRRPRRSRSRSGDQQGAGEDEQGAAEEPVTEAAQ